MELSHTSPKLTDTDLRSLSLPARLAVRRRRAAGEPTSAVEAEELRSLRGPTMLATFFVRSIVVLSLATLFLSVWTLLDATGHLGSQRDAAVRFVGRLLEP
jgi:hypothetical protein